MEFFALKHTATGRLMPALMSRSGRGGWSYWNPASVDRSEHGHGSAPRLFETLRSAQNARSAWAQGFHKREAWSGYDWEGIHDSEDNHVIEDAGRKLTDLEIVRVEVRCHLLPFIAAAAAGMIFSAERPIT